MDIVVDANLVVVLATKDPRAASVEHRMQKWLETGDELHAPALLAYEVANALTRLAASGRLAAGDVGQVWTLVARIPITYHPLPPATAQQVVATALRLGRQSAYDAAYLVLAQQLGAELWTLDGPLSRNSAGLGFPVHLIE